MAAPLLIPADLRAGSPAGRPLIMGIVNLTVDSFCGDGSLDPSESVAQARRLVAEGADIIDVGAESARTNRGPIPVAEEIRRLVEFRRALGDQAASFDRRFGDQVQPPALSLNTWRPEVVREVLPLGWDILNDMGGRVEEDVAGCCAAAGCSLVIMHSTAPPKVAQTHVRYGDVVEEVRGALASAAARASAAGLPAGRIILDPGIDFAKTGADNLRLLAELPRLAELGHPLLLAISRKSVIGRVLGLADPLRRDAGTIACAVAAQRGGAAILRVHAVAAAAEAVRVVAAVEAAGGTPRQTVLE